MKIKAFGYLAEILHGHCIAIDNVKDIESLRKYLSENYPEIIKTEYKIAIDHELVKANIPINNESEVVLLPPFAGG